jgi:uncharacterized protein YceH (UPF0502 family)
MPTTRDVQRKQRLKQYAKDIPRLESRLELAIERDETTYARNLERKIAHRAKRLKDGWPDDPPA